MKVLIAEDDAFSRKLLESILAKAGHDVVSCQDGAEALKKFQKDPSIEMVILDWMMPKVDGIAACKALKTSNANTLVYVIMLTAKNTAEDLAEAMDCGADDFISKPLNALELNARLNAGIRTIRLQNALKENIRELQQALDHVDQLQGIIPICAWCKRIRDDSKYWNSVEDYISEHSEAEFSHGICPDCREEHFPGNAENTAALEEG